MSVTQDVTGPSELENLLAVYGAIDIAVRDDTTGESRARVASIHPIYDSSEVHWYSEFLRWRADEGVVLPSSVGESVESTAQALANLSEQEPGSNRLAARRLLALYALTQAVPELYGPGRAHGPELAAALSAVLRPRMGLDATDAGRADAAAERLHEFIAADHPGS